MIIVMLLVCKTFTFTDPSSSFLPLPHSFFPDTSKSFQYITAHLHLLQFLPVPHSPFPSPFNSFQFLETPLYPVPPHPQQLYNISHVPDSLTLTQSLTTIQHIPCIRHHHHPTLHSTHHVYRKRLKNKVLCDTIHLKVHLMCNMSVQVEVVLI